MLKFHWTIHIEYCINSSHLERRQETAYLYIIAADDLVMAGAGASVGMIVIKFAQNISLEGGYSEGFIALTELIWCLMTRKAVEISGEWVSDKI